MAGPPTREGALVLDGAGTIVDLGPRADLRPRHAALPEERADGALLPGLVNAHTHLELSALAGRAPGGGGLVPWVASVVRAGAALADGERRAAALRAAAATAAAGVAAVGDVANHLQPTVEALTVAGLRGVVFHEMLGSRDAREGGALADAARELEALAAQWPTGVGYVLAPHAPYSLGPDLLRRVFTAAAHAGLPTSIHVAEDPDEIALLRDGGGRWPAVLASLGVPPASRTPGSGPLAYLERVGAFAGAHPPLLVHMVEASDEDRRLARRHGAPVVLCPRSNLHIGGRLPDVPALLAEGLSLAIGTDSLASAPDLSPWGEIAALAAHFPAVAPRVWLCAATRGGAEAMHLPALGALVPGCRPGVIEVDVGDRTAPDAALVREPAPRVRWRARP